MENWVKKGGQLGKQENPSWLSWDSADGLFPFPANAKLMVKCNCVVGVSGEGISSRTVCFRGMRRRKVQAS